MTLVANDLGSGGGAEQQREDDINIKFKYGKSVPGKEGVGTET